MPNSSYFTMGGGPREGRWGSTHTNNTVLSVGEENTGVGVLDVDPNLATSVEQVLAHLPSIVLVKPLPTLKDHNGKGLNGCRPVELFVHPMEEMRNG